MEFLRGYLILLACLIGVSQSARINAEDMDYAELADILAQYDGFEDEEDNIAAVINSPSAGQAHRDERKNLDFTIAKPSVANLFSPHVEMLRIVEAFIRLKGEMASRMNALITDNYDLFKSIYSMIVDKLGKVHSFTLIGISLLRQILEFAANVISAWKVNKPGFGINIDL